MRPVVFLLVDDNSADRELVGIALRACCSEAKLEIATDGEEALTYLFKKEHSETPPADLIMLDWNLPGKNGSEILSRIRSSETWKETPVVIFTGRHDRSITKEVKLGQNDFYVNKPDAVDSFFDTIKAIDAFVSKTVSTPQDYENHSTELRQLIA